VTIDLAYDGKQLELDSGASVRRRSAPTQDAFADHLHQRNWNQAVTSPVSGIHDVGLGIEQRREDPASPDSLQRGGCEQLPRVRRLSELLRPSRSYATTPPGGAGAADHGKTFVTKDGTITDTYTRRTRRRRPSGRHGDGDPVTDGPDLVAPTSLTFDANNWYIERSSPSPGVSFVAASDGHLEPVRGHAAPAEPAVGPLAWRRVSGADRSLTDASAVPKEFNAALLQDRARSPTSATRSTRSTSTTDRARPTRPARLHVGGHSTGFRHGRDA